MGATKFKTFLDENLIKYCENEKMDSHTSFPCERGEERLCFLGEEIKNNFPLLTPKRS